MALLAMDKQHVFDSVTLYFMLLFFFLGDNNGWPHLFDNYFGIPRNNLGTSQMPAVSMLSLLHFYKNLKNLNLV